MTHSDSLQQEKSKNSLENIFFGTQTSAFTMAKKRLIRTRARVRREKIKLQILRLYGLSHPARAQVLDHAPSTSQCPLEQSALGPVRTALGQILRREAGTSDQQTNLEFN